MLDDNIDEDISEGNVHCKMIQYTEKDTHTLVVKKSLSKTGIMS